MWRHSPELHSAAPKCVQSSPSCFRAVPLNSATRCSPNGVAAGGWDCSFPHPASTETKTTSFNPLGSLRARMASTPALHRWSRCRCRRSCYRLPARHTLSSGCNLHCRWPYQPCHHMHLRTRCDNYLCRFRQDTRRRPTRYSCRYVFHRIRCSNSSTVASPACCTRSRCCWSRSACRCSCMFESPSRYIPPGTVLHV